MDGVVPRTPEGREPREPVQFLGAAFEASDAVAILFKAVGQATAVQRVCRIWCLAAATLRKHLDRSADGPVHAYVSVNPVRDGCRSRTRGAMGPVRHLFLDADLDGVAVLADVERHRDLPPVSYLLHTSPGRMHLLWRVMDFDVDTAERLQRQLAHELGTDPAATAVTQMTRLPGFFNSKYSPTPLVTVEYRDVVRRFSPKDFPKIRTPARPGPSTANATTLARPETLDRARRYLSAVPPAVQGQHGDIRTFQVCCRLLRGFALGFDQALLILAEWNARCQPPWTEAELVAKLRSAARNGREPIGGLL